jgi:hypothetical protein
VEAGELLGTEVRDEAEVEQDHATLPRDEDVGGFDVAVKLAGLMQYVQSFGELEKAPAESHVVDGIRRVTRGSSARGDPARGRKG